MANKGIHSLIVFTHTHFNLNIHVVGLSSEKIDCGSVVVYLSEHLDVSAAGGYLWLVFLCKMQNLMLSHQFAGVCEWVNLLGP